MGPYGNLDLSVMRSSTASSSATTAWAKCIERWMTSSIRTPVIEERFPKLNRCLTGYDLAHIRDGNGGFNLNSILCGAEGTLAFIAEAKLNVIRIPEHAALVNVKYASFQDTLRDAQELLKTGSTSVEAIDSTVLNLAMNDIVWDSVRDLFPANEGIPIEGINLVEFTADDEAELRQGQDTDRQARCRPRPARKELRLHGRLRRGSDQARLEHAQEVGGSTGQCRRRGSSYPLRGRRRYRRRTWLTSSWSSARFSIGTTSHMECSVTWMPEYCTCGRRST